MNVTLYTGGNVRRAVADTLWFLTLAFGGGAASCVTQWIIKDNSSALCLAAVLWCAVLSVMPSWWLADRWADSYSVPAE